MVDRGRLLLNGTKQRPVTNRTLKEVSELNL